VISAIDPNDMVCKKITSYRAQRRTDPRQLNSVTFAGFPLGFYMAAQGSLIAFVIMLFVFAWRQDVIDREENMAEDE